MHKLRNGWMIFCRWFGSHEAEAIETKYIPNLTIRNLTSAVFWALLLLMGIFMLPQDLLKISESTIPQWATPHIIMRVVFFLLSLVFIYRSIRRQATSADFYFFIFLGLIYAIEGTIFNSSYYLSLIQITVGVAWFSTLPMAHLIFILPICGLLYCLSLVMGFEFGLISKQEVMDICIATGIAIFGGLIAGAFRDYWQTLSAKLIEKQMETNQRLIDLGKHLGIISHDINNLIGQQKIAVELLSSEIKNEDIASSQSHAMLTSVTKSLSKSTDHIFTLQKCVLSMSRNDPEELKYIDGQSLHKTITTLIPDFCFKAKPYLRIKIDENQLYYCAPYALSFALANAVNNSFEAAENILTSIPDFQIIVQIDKDEIGNMIAKVKDNGPGFPTTILNSVFKSRQSMGKDTKSHFGLGLHNISRYVMYQGGTVNVFNDEGAVVFITIPFIKNA